MKHREVIRQQHKLLRQDRRDRIKQAGEACVVDAPADRGCNAFRDVAVDLGHEVEHLPVLAQRRQAFFGDGEQLGILIKMATRRIEKQPLDDSGPFALLWAERRRRDDLLELAFDRRFDELRPGSARRRFLAGEGLQDARCQVWCGAGRHDMPRVIANRNAEERVRQLGAGAGFTAGNAAPFAKTIQDIRGGLR